MNAIEDIPLLYPKPFWAAYGALQESGVAHAQIRAHIAEQIIATLVEHATVYAIEGGRGVMSWSDEGMMQVLAVVHLANVGIPSVAVIAAVRAAAIALAVG